MWFSIRMLIFFLVIHQCSCTLNIITDLIKFNVAGHPLVHKEIEYSFDPDVGEMRARHYQELNGVHGEKAIEQLGLGIDGYDKERLSHQKIRDRILRQE